MVKKKKKRASKTAKLARPTQHLVLWRTTLDDVPLLLTTDRRRAFAYAKAPPEQDVAAGHRVMGLDICSAINTTVVSFRNGRPYRMEVVADFTFDPSAFAIAADAAGEQR